MPHIQILGRQKDLKDFVKRGQEEASIEIELQGPDHPLSGLASGQNIILTRTFKASGNTSSWKLNHAAASERKVKETIQALDIHVDNLW